MPEAPFACDPEATPGYQLGRTFMALKQGLRRAFLEKGLDLTPEQWTVLAFIWWSGGLSQCELAEKTTKDRTTITRILDRLEKKGLIRRERDAADRRCYRLFSTEKGLSLRAEAAPAVLLFRERVFGCLTPDETTALAAILSKINDRLE